MIGIRVRQAFRKAIDAGYRLVEFYRHDSKKLAVYLLNHISSNTQPGDVSQSITS